MTAPLKVSVTIPTYNCATYIEETLESVLAQTYRNLEVIVVDDGSTDNTREIVERYGPQVKYFYQSNQGLGAARNAGIRCATGDLVAFLDADDVWLPEKLERQVALFDVEPELGVCYTNFVPFGDAAEYDHGFAGDRGLLHKLPRRRLGASGYRFTASSFFKEFLANGTNPCWTSTVLVRRRCLSEVGAFVEHHDYQYGECDAQLWLRLAKHCVFGYVDAVLVRRRVRTARFASIRDEHERKIFQGTVRMLEELPSFISLTQDEVKVLRRRIAGYRFAAGYYEFSENRMDAAREQFAASLKAAHSWRACYYLVLSLMPPRCVRAGRRLKQRVGSRRVVAHFVATRN